MTTTPPEKESPPTEPTPTLMPTVALVVPMPQAGETDTAAAHVYAFATFQLEASRHFVWSSNLQHGSKYLRTYTDTDTSRLLVRICENDGNPIMFLGSLDLLSVVAKNRSRRDQS